MLCGPLALVILWQDNQGGFGYLKECNLLAEPRLVHCPNCSEQKPRRTYGNEVRKQHGFSKFMYPYLQSKWRSPWNLQEWELLCVSPLLSVTTSSPSAPVLTGSPEPAALLSHLGAVCRVCWSPPGGQAGIRGSLYKDIGIWWGEGVLPKHWDVQGK